MRGVEIMNTSRTYYEYPSSNAAINTLIPSKSVGSLTPAKAKRTWGELLRITGKSRRDSSTGRSTVYAAEVNLSPSNHQYATPYGHQQFGPSHLQNQDYERNYIAEYRQKYNSNDTFGNSQTSPYVVQTTPVKTTVNNGGNSVRYTDWFGSVVARKPAVRPSLHNLNYQYKNPNDGAWDSYVNNHSSSNVVDIPSAIPVQVYSNICLCSDQLFSTKSKRRKKCKKCGCKVGTIKNATTTASPIRIRPAIPQNLYQAPGGSNWGWPHLSQSYITPSYAVQPYMNGLTNDKDFGRSTPETVVSERSSRSRGSTPTRSSTSKISQSKAIPPPPTVPLPNIPKTLPYDHENDKSHDKSSIISNGTSAYDLLEKDRRKSLSSDTDDLSDNAVNEVWNNVNKHHKSNNQNSTNINIVSVENNSLIDRKEDVKVTSKKEGNKVKLCTNSFPNTCSINVSGKQQFVSNGKPSSIVTASVNVNTNSSKYFPEKISNRENRQLKRREGIEEHSITNDRLSSDGLSSSHLRRKNKQMLNKADTSNKRISAPKRDETKVVCIAGQRILFDKKDQEHSSKNNSSDFVDIDSWETDQEPHWSSENNLKEEKHQKGYMGNISLKNNFRKRSMSPSKHRISSISHTIHEVEEELEKDELFPTSKNTYMQINTCDEAKLEEDIICDQDDVSFYSTETLNQEESEETERDTESSSTNSPERRSTYHPTLSELLQVKSILKRPNSVDTSSETDSDFYLPTYSEFKRAQKKKKSVQFQTRHEITLVEDPEEPKDGKLPSTTTINVAENGSTEVIFEKQIPSSISHTSPNIDILEHIIENKDVQVHAFQAQSSPSEVEGIRKNYLLKDFNGDNEKDRSTEIYQRRSEISRNVIRKNSLKLVKPVNLKGIATPSRPTVPPPPPPPPSISSEPMVEREKEIDYKFCEDSSPPDTPPPPLPSSPPPSLYPPESKPTSFSTFSSFRDPKPDDSISIQSSSSQSSQLLFPVHELKENIPTNSSSSVFKNDESQTATIHSRIKASRTSLPFEMKFASSPNVDNLSERLPRTPSSVASYTKESNSFSKHKSFLTSMMEETDSEERFSDHIYEELPSVTSSPVASTSDLPSQERSIFDGASKYEILEFLQGARHRVSLEEDDNPLLATSDNLDNQLEGMALDDEDDPTSMDCTDDALMTYRYKDERSSNRSSNSDSSDNSVPLRSDKERLPAGEVERTDSGVGSETSKPTIVRRASRTGLPSTVLTGNNLKDRDLPPCDDCDSPVEAKVTSSGLMYAPLVCRRCSRRRQERKEIIMEIMETEAKYGRDLKVMVEQFYRPMQIAGLLTFEQIQKIFLNIEDLIKYNRLFSIHLRDAHEIAVDQGDEDLLSANIARLFLDASDMLHAFQNYCVKQSAASLFLQSLEKDRELLRIFLKVSQMENTLLRRMNLHSFLMVPVQRITKYPLLLSRLFKATPPSHSSREDCRRAREKIELYLHHINSETKETSPTKLWRRISLSVSNNSPAKRPIQPPDYDTGLKIRAVALEVLEWKNEEAHIVREGRLQCLSPESNNWTRRGRTLKMVAVQIVLVALGRPRSTLEEEVPEDGLIAPRDLGIRDAAILAFKDNRVSKTALIREPWLLTKCVLSWDEEGETEFFEITDMASKETFIFKDRDPVSTLEWFRSLQFHALAVGPWRRRRNALANIMICGAKKGL